jgi:hypothetical protein
VAIPSLDKENSPWLKFDFAAVDDRNADAVNDKEPLIGPGVTVVGSALPASGGEHHDGCLRAGVADGDAESGPKSYLITLHERSRCSPGERLNAQPVSRNGVGSTHKPADLGPQSEE